MYDTNGLTLDDFYPYGEQHEDTVKANENLPIAPLLEPINNLIEFGLRNLKATRYEVSINHWFDAVGACMVPYRLYHIWEHPHRSYAVKKDLLDSTSQWSHTSKQKTNLDNKFIIPYHAV